MKWCVCGNPSGRERTRGCSSKCKGEEGSNKAEVFTVDLKRRRWIRTFTVPGPQRGACASCDSRIGASGAYHLRMRGVGVLAHWLMLAHCLAPHRTWELRHVRKCHISRAARESVDLSVEREVSHTITLRSIAAVDLPGATVQQRNEPPRPASWTRTNKPLDPGSATHQVASD